MPIDPRSFTLLTVSAALATTATLIWSTTTSKHPPKTIPPPPQHPTYPTDSPRPLPYPPSHFIDGQRDVTTPYDSIRVYEFGPRESKRRILFLHGLTSPCLTLVPLAEGLASRGCRVMLMDLFGHGWSGGPSDLPHDSRLYTSQILLALASSPIPWTGVDTPSSGCFTIIGASLGAGLAVDFASYFPQLVDDLVLLVPAGLLRGEHTSWKSRLLYSEGLVPEGLRRWLVGSRLRNQGGEMVVRREWDGNTGNGRIDGGSGEQGGEQLDIGRTVAWQSDTHPGFLTSFMSTIRHAPITDQHSRWSVLGSHLSASKSAPVAADANAPSTSPSTLRSGKVLMILGAKDGLLPQGEIIADARTTLGEENVDIRIVEGGGHDLFYCMSGPVLDLIWGSWEGS